MNSRRIAVQEALVRLTADSAVSWPVFLVMVVWSGLLAVLASGSTVAAGPLARAVIGIVAGGMAFGLIVVVNSILRHRALRHRASTVTRTWIMLVTFVAAGGLRGLIVQVLFGALGYTTYSWLYDVQRI